MTGYPPEYPPEYPSGHPGGVPHYHEAAEWQAPPPPASPAPFALAPRPFLLTRGRTTGDSSAINIETQVVATSKGLDVGGHSGHERRDIVALCQDPLSVAEIAARLGLHLNVVRVLVSDLYASGHVTAHMPEFDAAHDVDTLRRVIRGLRAIS